MENKKTSAGIAKYFKPITRPTTGLTGCESVTKANDSSGNDVSVVSNEPFLVRNELSSSRSKNFKRGSKGNSPRTREKRKNVIVTSDDDHDDKCVERKYVVRTVERATDDSPTWTEVKNDVKHTKCLPVKTKKRKTTKEFDENIDLDAKQPRNSDETDEVCVDLVIVSQKDVGKENQTRNEGDLVGNGEIANFVKRNSTRMAADVIDLTCGNAELQNGDPTSDAKTKKLKKRLNSVISRKSKTQKRMKLVIRMKETQETVKTTSLGDVTKEVESCLRRSPRIRAVQKRICVEERSKQKSKDETGTCRTSLVPTSKAIRSLRLKAIHVGHSNAETKAKILLNRAKKKKKKKNDLLDVDTKLCKSFHPIFMSHKKSKIDPAILKRRRKFLLSGIPDQLQQQIAITKARTDLLGSWVTMMCHAEQRSNSETFWNLEMPTVFQDGKNDEDGGDGLCLNLSRNDEMFNMKGIESICSYDSSALSITKNLNSERAHEIFVLTGDGDSGVDMERCFDSYRERRSVVSEGKELDDRGERLERQKLTKTSIESDDVEILCGTERRNEYLVDSAWTTTYEPKHSDQVIGNENAVAQLQTSLMIWKKQNTNEFRSSPLKAARKKKSKRKRNNDDSESDASFSDSDDDRNCNCVLLTGPIGCGKTSAVYALAKEFDFKVLEVNASSRRTGKIVLDQLREATQSHQVSDVGSKTNEKHSKSIASFFCSPAAKSRMNPKAKAATDEDNCETLLSLILVEDVDVVFRDDDGFWGAINTIMATAKRPIILTSSDTRFAERGQIRTDFEHIAFEAPDCRKLASHLQLLCLAESCFVGLQDLNYVVRQLRYDFRKCVVNLQFWCQSDLKESQQRQEEKETTTSSVPRAAASECDTKLMRRFFDSFTIDCRSFECLIIDGCDAMCPTSFLELVHQRLSLLCGFPHRTRDEVERQIIDHRSKIRIEKRSVADGASTTTLSRLLHRMCVVDNMNRFDEFVREPTMPNVMPGLDDRLEEFRSNRGNSLISDVCDYLSRSCWKAKCCNDDAEEQKEEDTRQLYDDVFELKRFQRESSDVVCGVRDRLPLISKSNLRGITLDYLPSLRNICATENERRLLRDKRGGRFSHYLSSSVLYLDSSVISSLHTTFK